MKLLTSKKFLVLLASLALVTLIISFFVRATPKLISSTPAENTNHPDPTAPITLTFNRTVNLNDFRFEISPQESFTPSVLDSATIQLAFDKPLRINVDYSISIFYHNQTIDKLRFNTNATPETQFDARFNQELQEELDNNYPLIRLTPYVSSDYRVVYSAPLTLEITLKNDSLSADTSVERVEDWVSENGVDPSTHQYVIASP